MRNWYFLYDCSRNINLVDRVIGSFGGTLLAFPLPALFHWKLCRRDMSTFLVIKDFGIVVLGLLLTVLCTVVSIMNLVEVML